MYIRVIILSPIYRLMKTFKDYVKNTRYIEGSIAEAYITEEASLYASEYMPKPGLGSHNPRQEPIIEDFDEFLDGMPLGKGKRVTLTNLQYEQVSRYVLGTVDGIDSWRE